METINREEKVMTQRSAMADRQRQSAAHSMTVADLRDDAGDAGIERGDDAVRSGSIGIGMTAGMTFVLGGSGSAELLELFIESL
jgi:hypothetical protein